MSPEYLAQTIFQLVMLFIGWKITNTQKRVENKVSDTHDLVNGRMDELENKVVQTAYRQGGDDERANPTLKK